MKTPYQPSRRHFLKTSLAAPAALAAASTHAAATDESGHGAATPLPRRKLGTNGPEVTILNMGGQLSAHSPQYLDIAWRNGIRYFDTADCYLRGESERNIAKWLERYPERRKELFLVTKDHPKGGPEDLLSQIDNRLEAIGSDYVDAFFIHGIGVGEYGTDSLEWPKSDRLRKVFDQLKDSGKVRLCGFSCHDSHLIDYLNAAADGGFVDMIMLKYNPLFNKGDKLDQALDRLYDAGVGLVSMKVMRAFANAPRLNPEMEKLGLSTQQTLLHKVWTDTRISSVCSRMANVEQLEENTAAAQLYRNPLTDEQVESLRAVASVMPVQMCPGCSSCHESASHSDFAFNDISRYVAYYEQDGDLQSRSLYRELPDNRRDHAGVDLGALRDRCQYNVDYPEIIRRAENYFA